MERVDYKGKTILLKKDAGTEPNGLNIGGELAWVEGYWDEVTGKSWMESDGNPAAIMYAMRAGMCSLPTDNNVLYVKISGLGHLIHTSEIEKVVEK